MSEKIRRIEGGIVLLDFSDRTEPEPDPVLLEEAHRLIASHAPQEALVLTDVTNSAFNTTTIDMLRAFVTRNKPYVRASALVGLSAITRIIFRAVTTLTGRDIRPFETRKEAIAYLLTRRLAVPAARAASRR